MFVSPQARPKIDYEGAIQALKVSAKQVTSNWQGDDAKEAAKALASLCRAVARYLGGKKLAIDRSIEAGFGIHVLGLLRSELLKVWTRSEVLPSARTIVHTHRA